jgi:hypothetical protein
MQSDERAPTSKDSDLVDDDRLDELAIRLNNGQVVPVNSEFEVRIAR